MRLLSGLLAATFLWVAASTAAGGAIPAATTISGGGLPYPIRFSPIDADALSRRFDLPPKLDNPPGTTGATYTISSPYWDAVLGGTGKDGAGADAEARYFPEGGFVRARQAGKDVWLVLDLRQRAIIDRYSRLGGKGLLSTAPGELDLLRAAADQGEAVSVQIADRLLTADEAQAFWSATRNVGPPSEPSPAQLPRDADGFWLIFSLPEARSVQMLYSPSDRSLVDLQRFERYRFNLGLDGMIPNDGHYVPESSDEASPGSPLWWLLGIGLGAAAISAAVWSLRRLTATPGRRDGLS